MRIRTVCAVALAAAFQTGVASAAPLTFSNVVLQGSLAPATTYVTNPESIDFYMSTAAVGDYLSSRMANLTLTYIAESPTPILQTSMVLSVLGALSGSGMIFYNEVIEDLTNPASPTILAKYSAIADDMSDLPMTATLDFTRPAQKIKVKKSLLLTAFDTQALDLAMVSLVEQTIGVPEPGSLALLLIGAFSVVKRRRRAA